VEESLQKREKNFRGGGKKNLPPGRRRVVLKPFEASLELKTRRKGMRRLKERNKNKKKKVERALEG